jgi:hypothetical protein
MGGPSGLAVSLAVPSIGCERVSGAGLFLNSGLVILNGGLVDQHDRNIIADGVNALARLAL